MVTIQWLFCKAGKSLSWVKAAPWWIRKAVPWNLWGQYTSHYKVIGWFPAGQGGPVYWFQTVPGQAAASTVSKSLSRHEASWKFTEALIWTAFKRPWKTGASAKGKSIDFSVEKFIISSTCAESVQRKSLDAALASARFRGSFIWSFAALLCA